MSERYVDTLKQWLANDGKKTYEWVRGTMYLNPLFLFAEWLDEHDELASLRAERDALREAARKVAEYPSGWRQYPEFALLMQDLAAALAGAK